MATFPVDDRDPSVVYSGSWAQLSDGQAYKSTMTGLGVGADAESNVTISFVGELFNAFQAPLSHPTKGSGLEVYGTKVNGTDYAEVSDWDQAAPACLYTIDEGTPVRFDCNETYGVIQTTSVPQWAELLFLAPPLTNESHTLTIQFDSAFRTQYTLFLDVFVVDDGTTLPSATLPFYNSSYPNSTITTSSITPSGVTPGITPGMVTGLAQPPGKSMPKLPIGPAIGGALGALTFICTVLLILYLRRRKRREGHSDDNIGAPLAIGKNSQILQYPRWLIILDSYLIPSIQGEHRLAPTKFYNPPSTAAEGNHSRAQGRG